MRVLVCGDRHWDRLGPEYEIVDIVLTGLREREWEKFSEYGRREVTRYDFYDEVEFTIIEGGARGADECARYWVNPGTTECYQADWDKFGKAAGPIRNQRMLDEGKPDLVVAFHDDIENSKGTKHMVGIAKEAGVPTYIISRA